MIEYDRYSNIIDNLDQYQSYLSGLQLENSYVISGLYRGIFMIIERAWWSSLG